MTSQLPFHLALALGGEENRFTTGNCHVLYQNPYNRLNKSCSSFHLSKHARNIGLPLHPSLHSCNSPPIIWRSATVFHWEPARFDIGQTQLDVLSRIMFLSFYCHCYNELVSENIFIYVTAGLVYRLSV